MDKQVFGRPGRRSGFTLVELLVVLGIIAILAAVLFPAFRSMKERGNQVHCIANLKQIGIAVQQYYQDEKFYPASLTVLLPQSVDFDGDGTADNANSTAFLPTLDVARCKDDDVESTTPRLSYGPLAVTPASLTTVPPYTGLTAPADPSQYVWNYWGYRPDGYAYQTAPEAAAAQGSGPAYPYLVNKGSAYNHVLAGGYNVSAPRNVVEHSLSNRYAPRDTIITHCVYHRIPTANNLNNASELYYTADPTLGQGGRDIILFLSGDIKTLDVASWGVADGQWQAQNF